MNRTRIQQIITKVMNEEPDAAKVKNVSIFGSFLHGDNHLDSDIDLLFEMEQPMSLFEIGGVQYRLEQELGTKVDFVEKGSVIPQLKDKIIPVAKKIYVRKQG